MANNNFLDERSHHSSRPDHQPPTNHRHHHRLKNGSPFDRLSRSPPLQFLERTFVKDKNGFFLLETTFRVSRHPKEWIGGVGLRRDGVEPVAKKRAHEDSNARPPKKTVIVLPLGNYSSRQQKNLTWHRRLRVYHQPTTNHHHRLKNGSLFDRLSRSRSKFPRERSTPTPITGNDVCER